MIIDLLGPSRDENQYELSIHKDILYSIKLANSDQEIFLTEKQISFLRDANIYNPKNNQKKIVGSIWICNGEIPQKTWIQFHNKLYNDPGKNLVLSQLPSFKYFKLAKLANVPIHHGQKLDGADEQYSGYLLGVGLNTNIAANQLARNAATAQDLRQLGTITALMPKAVSPISPTSSLTNALKSTSTPAPAPAPAPTSTPPPTPTEPAGKGYGGSAPAPTPMAAPAPTPMAAPAPIPMAAPAPIYIQTSPAPAMIPKPVTVLQQQPSASAPALRLAMVPPSGSVQTAQPSAMMDETRKQNAELLKKLEAQAAECAALRVKMAQIESQSRIDLMMQNQKALENKNTQLSTLVTKLQEQIITDKNILTQVKTDYNKLVGIHDNQTKEQLKKIAYNCQIRLIKCTEELNQLTEENKLIMAANKELLKQLQDAGNDNVHLKAIIESDASMSEKLEKARDLGINIMRSDPATVSALWDLYQSNLSEEEKTLNNE